MQRLILFCTILLLQATINIYAQSVYYKHYTVKDGLPGNHVYMCHQDLDGYMWIATTSGLSRFDGKRFRNYGYEDGLSDNEVLLVSNDSRNRIWVRSFASKPTVIVLKKSRIDTPMADSIDLSSPALDISNEYYSKGNKTLYLSGFNFLAIIRHNTAPVKLYMTLKQRCTAFETEDGNIFIGGQGGLYHIADTTAQFYQVLNQDFTKTTYCNGLLYAVNGSDVIIYRYNNHHFSYLSTKHFTKNINLIHANKFGTWISFKNERGGLVYRDTFLSHLRYAVNIPGFINHFTEDEEGGVWISTVDDGVFYITDPLLVSYNVSDGLNSSVIYSIKPSSNKKVWIGNNLGDAMLVDYSNPKLVIEKRAKLGNIGEGNFFVTDILQRTALGVFFLSSDKLLRLHNSKISVLPTIGSNKSFYLINDSVLAIGGWNYELLNLKTLKNKVFKIGRVYSQCKDSSGVWLGGMNGLFKLEYPKAQIQRYDLFKGVRINALASWKSYLWIGTQNHGLYLIKNGRILKQFTSKNKDNLPSNTIKALAIENNDLWVGTNKGLLHLKVDYAAGTFVKLAKIDHNDGLQYPEVNDIKINRKDIIIGTYGGLTILNEYKNIGLKYRIKNVTVTNLDNGGMSKADSCSIPYSRNGLEISFSTVALRYADEINYSYRLNGFDNTWKSTALNTVQYTNLPPGKYSFQVIAHDSRGNSSNVHNVRLSILPAFWQTNWFIVTVIAFILLCIGAGILLYYRYITKKTNKELQQARLIAKAKLEALRSQLKPHFIFNSLNAISDYLYNNKNEDAVELLQGFAVLIRNGLKLAAKDFATVAEETAFLNKYLELERKKCENCFDYSFEVSEEINNIVIPSLITQPFVENAIVHGIRSVKVRRAVVSVSYKLLGDDMVCTITDNGIGIKRSLQHKRREASVGTALSEDRIRYFRSGLGIDIQLDVKDLSDVNENKTGTEIVITIKDIHQLKTYGNAVKNIDN